MLFFYSRDTEVFKADRNKVFASNKQYPCKNNLILFLFYVYFNVITSIFILFYSLR